MALPRQRCRRLPCRRQRAGDGPAGGSAPPVADLVEPSRLGADPRRGRVADRGALSSAIVDVPGASAVLRGGVVAYATDLKHALLGVDAALLAREGAIHPEVALQMADGVRAAAGGALGSGDHRCGGPGSAGREAPGRFSWPWQVPRGSCRESAPRGSGPGARSDREVCARPARPGTGHACSARA